MTGRQAWNSGTACTSREMKKTPSRQKNARLWGVFFLLKKTGVDVYDGPAN